MKKILQALPELLTNLCISFTIATLVYTRSTGTKRPCAGDGFTRFC